MHAVKKNKKEVRSQTFRLPGGRHDIALLRISLRLRNGQISVERICPALGNKPPGEIHLEEEVPASIIGHWLEISDGRGTPIYRRYVQRSLPFNLENADSRLQRIYSLERYQIIVPDLPEAATLTLYEQSLPRPGCRQPELKTRLQVELNSSKAQA